MTCSKCGQPLPRGSVYCQYCGAKVEKPAKNKSRSKPSRILAAALTVLLSVLSVASVGLNVYQYLHIQESSKKIAAIEQTLRENEQSTLDQEIASKNKDATILNQKYTIDSLREQVSLDNDFLEALNQSNLGYASDQFRASEGVIVLDRFELFRQFTLTTDFWEDVNVSIAYSPAKDPSATVSFDEDSWGTNTTLTIEPHHTGTTTVTFSNDSNSQTFKLVIFVSR